LKFVKKHKLTFPNGLDPNGDVFVRFKQPAHPAAFYIGADGAILGSRLGGIDEDQLARDFERFFGVKP